MFGWQKKSEEDIRKELNINGERDNITAVKKTTLTAANKKIPWYKKVTAAIIVSFVYASIEIFLRYAFRYEMGAFIKVLIISALVTAAWNYLKRNA